GLAAPAAPAASPPLPGRPPRRGGGARFSRGRAATLPCRPRPAPPGSPAMTATSTAAGRSSALVARTRTVEPPVRLLDALAPDGFAWLRDGTGFVTAGVAARVPAPLADRVLAAVEVHDAVHAARNGPIPPGASP